MSRTKGDGGLYPGRLVFSRHFEKYIGIDLNSFMEEITGNKIERIFNVGGPSIVALIHAAQLLQGTPSEVKFYGTRGNDKTGEYLQSKLEQTGVGLEHFVTSQGTTPSTIVLSDPTYNKGHGERIFINDTGAAMHFDPQDMAGQFFESDIVVFGGTALVPNLHDGLTELLEHSKLKGCISVVNTVYDFRSELTKPGQRWGLGKNNTGYAHIDLLIMDLVEAQHLSGFKDMSEAGKFFIDQGVSAFIITNGIEDTICYSNGKLFKSPPKKKYPVSAALIHDLNNSKGGDTTGCGDNFVGGVLASMAWQISEGKKFLNLEEVISWGTVSGGYGCFHVGGTMIENEPGEKLKKLTPYFTAYLTQING